MEQTKKKTIRKFKYKCLLVSAITLRSKQLLLLLGVELSLPLSLSRVLSLSLYSLTDFNAAPAHVVILIGVLFYLILIFHLHYYHIHTHTITHILTRVYSQAERHTHKQKFIHTNVCSQFTAVFCFSPLAFSIAFALTRSLRRLLPYAHPSPPLPSTSTSLPTSLVYFTYMLLFFCYYCFSLAYLQMRNSNRQHTKSATLEYFCFSHSNHFVNNWYEKFVRYVNHLFIYPHTSMHMHIQFVRV